MNARDAVNQAFPPVLTAVVLLAFGVVLALDWVSLVRGEKETPRVVTVVATVGWLVAVAAGVVTWTA